MQNLVIQAGKNIFLAAESSEFALEDCVDYEEYRQLLWNLQKSVLLHCVFSSVSNYIFQLGVLLKIQNFSSLVQCFFFLEI